jgi:hypothetical protein
MIIKIMESFTIIKVFNISENYSLEELKKSYIDIIDKLYQSDKTQVEKDLLYDQYKKLYLKGKQIYFYRERINENSYDFANRIRRIYNPLSMFDKMIENFTLDKNYSNIPNTNTNTNTTTNTNYNVYSHLHSQSSSYISNTNPDGSKTVIKKETRITNGDENKTIDFYKILPDGKKVPLSLDEIKQLNKFSNLQIK